MKEKYKVLEMLQAEVQRKGIKMSEEELNESAEIAVMFGQLYGSHVVSVEMKREGVSNVQTEECEETKTKSGLKIKKKRNNLIEIDYTEDGDQVTILAIRNMLSQTQIIRKYGIKVYEQYGSAQERIEASREYKNFHCRYRKDLTIDFSSLPLTWPRSRFNRLITYYRKAGENLCRVVKEVKAQQELCKSAQAVPSKQTSEKRQVHTITI